MAVDPVEVVVAVVVVDDVFPGRVIFFVLVVEVLAVVAALHSV